MEDKRVELRKRDNEEVVMLYFRVTVKERDKLRLLAAELGLKSVQELLRKLIRGKV